MREVQERTQCISPDNVFLRRELYQQPKNVSSCLLCTGIQNNTADIGNPESAEIMVKS